MDAPLFPQRKANRLAAFDYASSCACFITIRVKPGGPCLWAEAKRASDFPDPEETPWQDETSPPYSVGAAISRPSHWRASLLSDAATVCPPLSVCGQWVEKAICAIPRHYPLTEVNKYCVMPDHLHLILFLNAEDPADLPPAENGRLIAAPTGSGVSIAAGNPGISRMIGYMKRWVSLQVGNSIWQKSFYDHVIRNETEYRAIWRYIDENPLKRLYGKKGGAP